MFDFAMTPSGADIQMTDRRLLPGELGANYGRHEPELSRDARSPAGSLGADEAAVTLATTNKALLIPSKYNQLGTQFFNKVGRKLRMNVAGKITTSTSPGTLTLAAAVRHRRGRQRHVAGRQRGADADRQPGEHPLGDRALHPLPRGRRLGRAVRARPSAIRDGDHRVGTFLLPASGAAQVGSLDLTGTSIPSLQALVSAVGGGITMTPQDYDISPMN
jgi:hypothetical protein